MSCPGPPDARKSRFGGFQEPVSSTDNGVEAPGTLLDTSGTLRDAPGRILGRSGMLRDASGTLPGRSRDAPMTFPGGSRDTLGMLPRRSRDAPGTDPRTLLGRSRGARDGSLPGWFPDPGTILGWYCNTRDACGRFPGRFQDASGMSPGRFRDACGRDHSGTLLREASQTTSSAGMILRRSLDAPDTDPRSPGRFQDNPRTPPGCSRDAPRMLLA